ncbi:hypothetical protein M501DRAFT_1016832 [Patellaria atrata CBS 101060]|uniref:Uncharacterized protein n=1 Tax=Patellaria atrata CBS 101060 TaxID=1346257 RepID=A0A9P4S9Y3_9PEZI|nr:hypothetical protein M501DRAFT_1016832 [Patellaria atrata CBS 101060]
MSDSRSPRPVVIIPESEDHFVATFAKLPVRPIQAGDDLPYGASRSVPPANFSFTFQQILINRKATKSEYYHSGRAVSTSDTGGTRRRFPTSSLGPLEEAEETRAVQLALDEHTWWHALARVPVETIIMTRPDGVEDMDLNIMPPNAEFQHPSLKAEWHAVARRRGVAVQWVNVPQAYYGDTDII